MITVYQFQPALGIPNLSGFCLKLETYLRMAELPYQTVSTVDLQKAPKGKLPYIEDQGQIIGDSSFIIQYLKQTYGDRLDAHLSPSEQAIALAMQRLFEDHLYWIALYSRWCEPDNFALTKKAFFGGLPKLLQGFVAKGALKQIQRDLHGQGISRHSRAEIYQLGQEDLTAIANFLDTKPYFMGDRPTSLDATAYGMLANLLRVPYPSPLAEFASSLENLNQFCDRVSQTYFSDFSLPSSAPILATL